MWSHKICSHCKIDKPASEFNIANGAASGLQAWCKLCLKTRDKPKDMVEYECSGCGQPLRRCAKSRYRKVNERTQCHRCTVRGQIMRNGGRTLNYTGSEFFSGKTIAQWKLSASRRGYSWELTREQLDAKYREQAGSCALSGISFVASIASPYRASIDRKDSTRDYVIGNFQFVCSVVNVMKNKIAEPLFRELCGKIAAHRNIVITARARSIAVT